MCVCMYEFTGGQTGLWLCVCQLHKHTCAHTQGLYQFKTCRCSVRQPCKSKITHTHTQNLAVRKGIPHGVCLMFIFKSSPCIALMMTDKPKSEQRNRNHKHTHTYIETRTRTHTRHMYTRLYTHMHDNIHRAVYRSVIDTDRNTSFSGFHASILVADWFLTPIFHSMAHSDWLFFYI